MNPALCLILGAVLASSVGYAEAAPESEPKILFENSKQFDTPACRDFLRYSTKELNTYGLVILKGGEKQLELYDHGADPGKKFKLWSVSKTVFSLLLGSEVQKKSIGLDEKVSEFFSLRENSADFSREFRNWIRVRHLWTFGSGIQWCETDACDTSTALRLYYGEGRSDATGFILGQPVIHAPGTFYNYSSADVTLLSSILKRVHSAQEYALLPATNLFGPLNITDWAWERDGKGVYLAAADLFLKTSDLAKLGKLILQRGEWTDDLTGKKTRVFSEDFYREMTRLNYPIQSEDTPELIRKSEGPVGGLIWLNEPYPGQLPSLRAAPRDTVYTCGYWGQYLLVFPKAGVVIARNGADANYVDALDTFSDKATRCLAPEQWQDPTGKEKAPEVNATVTELLSTFQTLQKKNLSARAVAQELCECLFIEGFPDPKTCDQLNPQEMFKKFYDTAASVDYGNKSVRVKTKFKDPTKFLLGSPESVAGASYVTDPGTGRGECHPK